MDELENQIRGRVLAAQESLLAAQAAGNDFLASVREGELDSLARLAAAHGFDDIEFDHPNQVPAA